LKDVQYYKKEARLQTLKIEEMKNNNQDAYDIKKQEEVLAETNKMIPDSIKRLENSITDLQSYLSSARSDLAGTDELTAAENSLANANTFLQT